MSDVVPITLRVVKPEPREAVVSILRDLLAQAERGEITGVSVAVEYSDGGTGTAHRCERPRLALGTLEILRHRILHTRIEE